VKTFLKRYSIPLALALICLLLAVFSHQVSEMLIYRRSLITEGEWWRLLTGNLLHTNFNHLLLNLGGLFLIWFIYWDIGNWRWQLGFLLFPLIANTLLLYFLTPSMEAYVGLSGALHGTIVAFGLADGLKNRWIAIGLLLGVAIKLGFEQWQGSPKEMEALIGATVAIDAHLWGAISGLLMGLAYLMTHYRPPENTKD
jgi:rhomboid family GlyGly-CTERM serine protease